MKGSVWWLSQLNNMGTYFDGFPKESIDFLWELRMNNNTEWFNTNRGSYNILIKEPMKLFAVEMAERLNNKRMGEVFVPAISRANRDIRFSKDKSPYKDRKWVVFNYGEGRWQEKCCFYFEISPEGWSSGMGFYEASSAYMAKYRKKLSADTAGLKRLNNKLKKQTQFVVDVQLYKKNFVPEGADPEIVNWYQYRNLAIISDYKITDSLFKREILDEVENGYEFLKPFFEFFKDI
ncbi:hypothetical protein IMSAG049_00950 [Clostridiales bacterium]|nr:hypothetical protein IMSAG049_00950 [Clostridiales bacterium]